MLRTVYREGKQRWFQARERSFFLTTKRGRESMAAVRAAANSQRGRRCFLIGNGRSVLDQDLEPLRNELTLGVNRFYLLGETTGLSPAWSLIEDIRADEETLTRSRDLPGTRLVLPWDFAPRGIDGDNVVFCPFRRYYRTLPRVRFSHDAERAIYWGGTVAYMALQWAAHLGCSPIYVIGMDLNWKVPDSARLTDRGTLIHHEADDNHFSPDYLKGKEWFPPDIALMHNAWRTAYRALEARGVPLFNATAGGQLTHMIPRVDYESLFPG